MSTTEQKMFAVEPVCVIRQKSNIFESMCMAFNLEFMAKILCMNVLLLCWVAVGDLTDSFVDGR